MRLRSAPKSRRNRTATGGIALGQRFAYGMVTGGVSQAIQVCSACQADEIDYRGLFLRLEPTERDGLPVVSQTGIESIRVSFPGGA